MNGKLFSTFLVFVACAIASSAQEAKRNVILYVVDDQGTNDAGCYGNPVIRTPGLDALAANGVRMTHAFATTPSCSASRSVLLTGLHNHANGHYGHEHAYHHFSSFDRVRSLPVRLAEAGYRTMRAGKYHVAPESVYRFQESVKTMAPDAMAEACAGFIEAKSEQPFFLYFCTTEPHRPFRREGSQEISPDEVIVPDYLPDSPESRAELARYYMSVERADRGLVRLIEILKRSGRWDNTLVIYLSDNGIAFPGAKTNVYEPGVRLPCVVRNPFGERAGDVSNALISYVDITPTILDFVAVTYDANEFHGRSFLNAIEAKEPEGWDEVFLSHTFHEITMYYPMRVLRERRYKLIWNLASGLSFPFASDLFESETWQGVLRRGDEVYGRRDVEAYLHRPEFELYDLEADPDEVTNLAAEREYSDVLGRMQADLREKQEKMGDPWVVKWSHE